MAALIETQRDSVKAVLTGTPSDGRLEGEYRQRCSQISPWLNAMGIEDPFQWPDLANASAWGKQWSTYAERRGAVDLKVAPVLDRLQQLQEGVFVEDWGGSPDHWGVIDERIVGLRKEMDAASVLDDFQDVGRRGREIIIATVNEMFQDDMVPEDTDAPKGSDAKARFSLVVDHYAPGNSHAELRKLARAAWGLANKVTHSSSTSRVDAFATAQATVLLVRTLAEMHRAGSPTAE